MTSYKHRAATILLVIILTALPILSACNFPGFANAENAGTPNAYTVKTHIAQTVAAQISPSPGTGVSPAAPTGSPTATLTQPPTEGAPPATDAPPPAAGQPTIRADVDTNCRLGPSKLYQVIGYVLVGQESSVHGRNSEGTWWYIATPLKPGSYCWAWSGSTRVEGDTSALPVITPPPPPTATPTVGMLAIVASFSDVHACSGNPTAVFQITNSGTVPVRSVSLFIKDMDTNTTLYSASSNAPFFDAPNGCPPGGSALGPGGTAYIGGAIGVIPAGTNMRMKATSCSELNLGGICLDSKLDWVHP